MNSLPPVSAQSRRGFDLSTWSQHAWREVRSNAVFWLGLSALALPTLYQLAVHTWDKEQNAHAPIVLATAIWLLVRAYPGAARVARPPAMLSCALAMAFPLALYAVARLTGLLEVRGLAVYLCGLAIVYSLGGSPVLKNLWFPLVYCAFLIPIPDTLIDIGTQPIKLAISSGVVKLLSAFDYPVAQSGVSIFIGQFELLIAAACSGLNSLISLTALGAFYIYIRRSASIRYTVVLVLAIIPIAVLVNFIRVLILVLVTYHAGEATAESFFHETSAIFLFVFALLTIFAFDRFLAVIWPRQHHG